MPDVTNYATRCELWDRIYDLQAQKRDAEALLTSIVSDPVAYREMVSLLLARAYDDHLKSVRARQAQEDARELERE